MIQLYFLPIFLIVVSTLDNVVVNALDEVVVNTTDDLVVNSLDDVVVSTLDDVAVPSPMTVSRGPLEVSANACIQVTGKN